MPAAIPAGCSPCAVRRKVVADAIVGERAEFDMLSAIPVPRFPGGPALRTPTLMVGMSLAALRDSL